MYVCMYVYVYVCRYVLLGLMKALEMRSTYVCFVPRSNIYTHTHNSLSLSLCVYSPDNPDNPIYIHSYDNPDNPDNPI